MIIDLDLLRNVPWQKPYIHTYIHQYLYCVYYLDQNTFGTSCRPCGAVVIQPKVSLLESYFRIGNMISYNHLISAWLIILQRTSFTTSSKKNFAEKKMPLQNFLFSRYKTLGLVFGSSSWTEQVLNARFDPCQILVT